MSYYGFKEPYRIDMGKDPLPPMTTEDAVFYSAVILFFVITCFYSDYKRKGQPAGQALVKAVIVGALLYLGAVLVLIAFFTHPFISLAVSAVIIAINTYRNVLDRKEYQRQSAAAFLARQQQLQQQAPPAPQVTAEASRAESPPPQVTAEASRAESPPPQVIAEASLTESPAPQVSTEASPAEQDAPASPLRPRPISRTRRPPRRDKHR